MNNYRPRINSIDSDSEEFEERKRYKSNYIKKDTKEKEYVSDRNKLFNFLTDRKKNKTKL